MAKDRYTKWIRFLLLGVLIVIGILVHDDFGVTVDESLQRRHGIVTWRWLNRNILNRGVFVNEGTEDLSTYSGRYYGVILQLPLVIAEDVYQTVSGSPMSTRAIYLMRHAWVYLFFILALMAFFEICNEAFHQPLLSASGVLMILVFGRYFADSCFNIKDSLFASLTVLNLFLAGKVVRSGRKPKWLFIYAVETALMVSSRVVGALYPLLFLLCLIIADLRKRNRPDFRAWLIIASSYPIWLLFTPASWSNPIQYSLRCVHKFSDYNWQGYFVYDGAYQGAHNSPPEYFIRWIGMTVPLLFLLLSIIGIVLFVAGWIRRRNGQDQPGLWKDMLFTLAFSVIVITLGYQAIKRPTVYNGWRHVYYLYPLIILFAIKAMAALLQTRALGKALKAAVCVLLAGTIVYTGWETFSAPAFAYGSYNLLGRQTAAKFERDEWFIGNYSVLRWLAANTGTEEPVGIGKLNTVLSAFQLGVEMLPENEGRHLYISDDPEYIILRYDTPASETAVTEGYEHIREFESYGVKQYAVLKRIEQQNH